MRSVFTGLPTPSHSLPPPPSHHAHAHRLHPSFAKRSFRNMGSLRTCEWIKEGSKHLIFEFEWKNAECSQFLMFGARSVAGAVLRMRTVLRMRSCARDAHFLLEEYFGNLETGRRTAEFVMSRTTTSPVDNIYNYPKGLHCRTQP